MTREQTDDRQKLGDKGTRVHGEARVCGWMHATMHLFWQKKETRIDDVFVTSKNK